MRTKSSARYPKILRRVGGYNLDAFIESARRASLESRPTLMVGLGRHARRRARGQGPAGAAAEGEGGPGHPVRRSSRSTRGHAAHPDAPPLRRRSDGRLHPRQHETEPGARSHAAHVHRRRPGRAALRGVLRGSRATTCRRGSRRSKRDLARARLRLPLHPRPRPSGAAAHLEPPRSGARSIDGDARRSQVASRSSKTRRWRPIGCATTSTDSSS